MMPISLVDGEQPPFEEQSQLAIRDVSQPPYRLGMAVFLQIFFAAIAGEVCPGPVATQFRKGWSGNPKR
jgi:hypothetical protein